MTYNIFRWQEGSEGSLCWYWVGFGQCEKGSPELALLDYLSRHRPEHGDHAVEPVKHKERANWKVMDDEGDVERYYYAPLQNMHVVFDLDGTIANTNHRNHHLEGSEKNWTEFFAECKDDLAVYPMISMIATLLRVPHCRVEIWTARNDSTKSETLSWLARHGIRASRSPSPTYFDSSDAVTLRMRPSGDTADDTELKRAWLDEARAQKRTPTLIFEDRQRVVNMWREEGIVCCQVAPGDF